MQTHSCRHKDEQLTKLQSETLEAARRNHIHFILKNKSEYTHEDIDVVDHHGNTALFYAVKNMNIEMIKLILDIGANINKKNEFGNSPLH